MVFIFSFRPVLIYFSVNFWILILKSIKDYPPFCLMLACDFFFFLIHSDLRVSWEILHQCLPLSVNLLTPSCFTKGIFITKVDFLFLGGFSPESLFNPSLKATRTATYLVPGRITGSDGSDALQDHFCAIRRGLFWKNSRTLQYLRSSRPLRCFPPTQTQRPACLGVSEKIQISLSCCLQDRSQACRSPAGFFIPRVSWWLRAEVWKCWCVVNSFYLGKRQGDP